jgi:cytochrome P450
VPLDFRSQEYLQDPARALDKLRAAGPVVQVQFPIIGKTWITTTHDMASRVLKDDKTFAMRSEKNAVAGFRFWMPGFLRALADNMLTMDEPDHTRLRSIVDEAFRRRAILDMEPHILEIADGLASELFANGSPADIVERYARLLPLAVICELLGLPQSDRQRFIVWSGGLARLRGPLSFLTVLVGVAAMQRYLGKRLQVVREQGGEGLMAELVQVEKEGGRISSREMVSMVFLLLGAGAETTTHLISGSVFELLKDRPLRDWLEADWNRANLAIEEFLRFVSPVQFSKPRYIRSDVVLDGVRLSKGEKVMAMLGAANLDPDVHEQADRLDLQRRPNRHLSFGTGIHFCLGHQLARIEGKCALQALFRRWPELQLAIPATQVRWRERPGLRAVEALPVVPGGKQPD